MSGRTDHTLMAISSLEGGLLSSRYLVCYNYFSKFEVYRELGIGKVVISNGLGDPFPASLQ